MFVLLQNQRPQMLLSLFRSK